MNVEKAGKTDLAFAVYKRIVFEVYRITAWVPGLSTYNSIPVSDETKRRDKQNLPLRLFERSEATDGF